MVKIDNIGNFDLAQTLDCGQAFRWREQPDGSFAGVAMGKKLTLTTSGSTLQIDGIDESEYSSVWADYFDLNRDYGEIGKTLSKIHPVLREAFEYAPGIRILEQEPWEALCSFIISQNNNIPRIKLIIDRLCEAFGSQIEENCYSFPSAEKLASLSVEELAPIKAGFRARYILDAATKVSSGEIDLNALKTAPLDEVRSTLMTITGVGPKVADCTMLYGLHRLESFPLDVWMKRAMTTLFPELTPSDFGEYGGIAQQYIFYFIRGGGGLHPRAGCTRGQIAHEL